MKMTLVKSLHSGDPDPFSKPPVRCSFAVTDSKEHINQDAYITQVKMTNISITENKNEIFLIYKEILMGSGAKSYMWKGFPRCANI
jgi:hypothetical protein